MLNRIINNSAPSSFYLIYPTIIRMSTWLNITENHEVLRKKLATTPATATEAVDMGLEADVRRDGEGEGEEDADVMLNLRR